MKTIPNCCFVDSSAFIALNHVGDSNHEKAYATAKQLQGYRFMVTDSVITETYALLRYRLGFHSSSNFLDIILNSREYEIVEINPAMRQDVMRLLEKYSDHKISYCNALSVVAMNHHQIENIFAFDRHFEMMGVKLL